MEAAYKISDLPWKANDLPYCIRFYGSNMAKPLMTFYADGRVEASDELAPDAVAAIVLVHIVKMFPKFLALENKLTP